MNVASDNIITTTEIYTIAYTLSLHDALPIYSATTSKSPVRSLAIESPPHVNLVHPQRDESAKPAGLSGSRTRLPESHFGQQAVNVASDNIITTTEMAWSMVNLVAPGCGSRRDSSTSRPEA